MWFLQLLVDIAGVLLSHEAEFTVLSVTSSLKYPPCLLSVPSLSNTCSVLFAASFVAVVSSIAPDGEADGSG